MAIVKKNDFVEIEYTGWTKEDNIIFDTTQEKAAKDNGVYDKNSDYSPLIICVGENYFLKGLEEQIIGKETEREYKIEVSTDNAYGKKDGRLIHLIPTNKFSQQDIHPVPGLQLNIDGVFGIVKTVSGGRCLVDFNHPLAGKDLLYDVKINRIINDDSEKLNSLLKMRLHINDAKIEMQKESADITLKHEIPEKTKQEFGNIVEKTIHTITSVKFTIVEEKKNK